MSRTMVCSITVGCCRAGINFVSCLGILRCRWHSLVLIRKQQDMWVLGAICFVWFAHFLSFSQWPGAWTMGNLGRPGYGASTDGTVADNQSPLILWLWVFLFRTWQEPLRRFGNAGKHLFRVYWRDWHEPIILKINIYHFELSKFGHPPKQLAKNAEKCAIDSFYKAEDDPTKIGQFPWAVQQINGI